MDVWQGIVKKVNKLKKRKCSGQENDKSGVKHRSSAHLNMCVRSDPLTKRQLPSPPRGYENLPDIAKSCIESPPHVYEEIPESHWDHRVTSRGCANPAWRSTHTPHQGNRCESTRSYHFYYEIDPRDVDPHHGYKDYCGVYLTHGSLPGYASRKSEDKTCLLGDNRDLRDDRSRGPAHHLECSNGAYPMRHSPSVDSFLQRPQMRYRHEDSGASGSSYYKPRRCEDTSCRQLHVESIPHTRDVYNKPPSGRGYVEPYHVSEPFSDVTPHGYIQCNGEWETFPSQAADTPAHWNQSRSRRPFRPRSLFNDDTSLLTATPPSRPTQMAPEMVSHQTRNPSHSQSSPMQKRISFDRNVPLVAKPPHRRRLQGTSDRSGNMTCSVSDSHVEARTMLSAEPKISSISGIRLRHSSSGSADQSGMPLHDISNTSLSTDSGFAAFSPYGDMRSPPKTPQQMTPEERLSCRVTNYTLDDLKKRAKMLAARRRLIQAGNDATTGRISRPNSVLGDLIKSNHDRQVYIVTSS